MQELYALARCPYYLEVVISWCLYICQVCLVFQHPGLLTFLNEEHSISFGVLLYDDIAGHEHLKIELCDDITDKIGICINEEWHCFDQLFTVVVYNIL